MWDKNAAREEILKREEPKEPYIKKMFLAHERYWGRTEETGINRQRELEKLNHLIENMPLPFPERRTYEHPAMKELRAYVHDYQQALEKRRVEIAPPELNPDREEERDRGR